MQKIVKNQDILEIVLLSGHFEPFSSHFCHTQKNRSIYKTIAWSKLCVLSFMGDTLHFEYNFGT